MSIPSDLRAVGELDLAVFQDVFALVTSAELDFIDINMRVYELAESAGEAAEGIRNIYPLVEFIAQSLVGARNFEQGLAEVDSRLERLSANDELATEGWRRIRQALLEDKGYLLREKTELMKNRYARVTAFHVTSDVRPVFELERQEVKNLLFPQILKIETSDDQTFICEVYDDEIDDMITELELAKNKCQMMREYIGPRRDS